MPESVVRVSRELERAPVVVWDALVDPVLVEGWLHPDALLVQTGTVLRFDEPDALDIESPEFGRVTFTLTELSGGSRGAATLLTLSARGAGDPGSSASVEAGWSIRLDQLEELLRGHPVDWDHWARDHQADYEEYLARALSARAH